MQALAISQRALISLLNDAAIVPTWFTNPIAAGIKRPATVLVTDEVSFVITPECEKESPFLIIRTETGLFSRVEAPERRGVFERCARLALRHFDNAIRLPPHWWPFHHHNLVSIFAFPADRGGSERLVAETGPRQSSHIYVCGFQPAAQVKDLSSYRPNYDAFDSAMEALPGAFRRLWQSRDAAAANVRPNIPGQVDLNENISQLYSRNLTYDEWYPRNLSSEQLSFVEHPLDRPLKLRGAAGTGKTLAMVIKTLRTIYLAEEAGCPCRILYATHSWGAAEMVEAIIRAIDTRDSFRTRTDGISLDLYPILTLAEEVNRNKEAGRKPLGNDSEEGKRFALETITKELDRFRHGDWFAYKGGCSEHLIDQIESASTTAISRRFVWDLMVEFGCVIGAAGIFPRDQAKYMRIRRLRWMMRLDNDADKEVVFYLYRKYMDNLATKDLISSDQIINDYLNHLSTFYWDGARNTLGYDIIFVDEMHLFNAQERMVFHNLLANPAGPVSVVMALDPKQSPRETFTQIEFDNAQPSNGLLQEAGLGNAENIDLTIVYRYTPQIAALIGSFIYSAPALDLDADWQIQPAHSTLPDADVPGIQVHHTATEMFAAAVKRALSASRGRNARRVAILCLNHERFERFARVAKGQYKDRILVVSSREDVENIRIVHRRVVLSMPEYVAGLQFERVYLLDANQEEASEGQYSAFEFRRFLSEMYLGASRAEKVLEIYCTVDRGGPTPLLAPAIRDHLLVPMDQAIRVVEAAPVAKGS